MKIRYTTLLGISLLGTLTAAQAEFHSGPRLGFGIGYKNYHVGHELTYSPQTGGTTPHAENIMASHSRHLASLEFTGGYDFLKENVYSAIEASYRYSPGRNSSSLTASQAGVATVPFTLSQQHDHDFGIAGHLGYKLAPNLIMYGIIQLRYGRFETKFTNNDANSTYKNATDRSFKWGYGGGLGLRFNLPANWSLATEATYDTYQRTRINENLETDGRPGHALYATSKRPRIIHVMFKLHKSF